MKYINSLTCMIVSFIILYSFVSSEFAFENQKAYATHLVPSFEEGSVSTSSGTHVIIPPITPIPKPADKDYPAHSDLKVEQARGMRSLLVDNIIADIEKIDEKNFVSTEPNKSKTYLVNQLQTIKQLISKGSYLGAYQGLFDLIGEVKTHLDESQQKKIIPKIEALLQSIKDDTKPIMDTDSDCDGIPDIYDETPTTTPPGCFEEDEHPTPTPPSTTPPSTTPPPPWWLGAILAAIFIMISISAWHGTRR